MPVVRTLRSGVRRTTVALAVGASTLALAACGVAAPSSSTVSAMARSGTAPSIAAPSSNADTSGTSRERDEDTEGDDEADDRGGGEHRVDLSDAAAAQDAQGPQTVAITTAGTHRIHGSLGEGVLQVRAPEGEVVHLVMEGVSVLRSDGPALSVTGPGDTLLELAEETTNALLSVADDAVSAAGDLFVTGPGSLVVTALQGDGLTSGGEAVLDAGHVAISAGGDAVHGKDAVRVLGGEVDAVGGARAFRSSGPVELLGGRLHVDSQIPSAVPSADAPAAPALRTVDVATTAA